MKYYLKFVLMSAAMVLQGFCKGGVPLEWTRRPDSITPANFTAHHGEALEFRCEFRGFGELPFGDGSDVRLYFQTNGMCEAWWSVPAAVSSNTVSAAWSPEMDSGADRWTYFFGRPGVVYASAIVRFVKSPGFTPGVLPPPAMFEEMVAAIVTNTVPGGVGFGDNWRITSGAWDGFTLQSVQWVEEPQALYGGFWSVRIVDSSGFAVGDTLTEDPPTAWRLLPFGGMLVERDSEGVNALGLAMAKDLEGVVTSVSNTVVEIVTNEIMVGWTEWEVRQTAGYAGIVCSGVYATDGLSPDEPVHWMIDCKEWSETYGELREQKYHVPGTGAETNLTFTAGLTATRRRIIQNALGLAMAKDVVSAEAVTNIAREVSAPITNDIEKLKTESTLVYRLFSGSNIVMEVTNYNSRVNPPAMKLERLNDKGIYEVMWTETNGLERTYQRAASNTAEQVAALDRKAAETYAPRGWSATTSGLGADAPKDTTWISTPTTVIAGGLEYSKVVTSSGQLWFLRSNGMVANMGGNSGGYFDISASDGTSVFSIEKTDSYMAPVDADGISVNGNTVTIRLSVVSADHPFLRYAPTLNAPITWQKEEDGFSSPIAVSWSGSSGAWVATVTTTAKEGFFQFEFFQEGGTKIKSGGAMDVSTGGILCTDGIHKCRPVYNSNGTVTLEVF